MMLNVRSVKYIDNFTVWVCFDDGVSGNINLKDALKGSVFLPLKDVNVFSTVYIDPELETLVWPNGADFAPEFLKSLYHKQNQSDL